MTDITYSTLRRFMKSGYESNPPDEIDGYILDKSISHSTANVYYNPEKNEAIINHRGSQGMFDWLYNSAYMYGGEDYYKLTPRYYEAKKAQEATEKKYGNQNTITIGHSAGGLLSELLGKNSKQIITLNKATRPVFFPKIKHKNQLDIRSKCDIVSAGGYYDKEIECSSLDILAEHKTDILDRIGEKMVGEGNIFNRPIRVYIDDRRDFNQEETRRIINKWIRSLRTGNIPQNDQENRDFAHFIQTERGTEIIRNLLNPELNEINEGIWFNNASIVIDEIREQYPDEALTDDESIIGTGKNNISSNYIEMNDFTHLHPNAFRNIRHHLMSKRDKDDSRYIPIPDSRFTTMPVKRIVMKGNGINPAEPMIKNPHHQIVIPEKGMKGTGMCGSGRCMCKEEGEACGCPSMKGKGCGCSMKGKGMCGSGKGMKGSAEMKEKMAKLRAMRRNV